MFSFLYIGSFPSREEVYSDWLQWVLEQVADARLIGRIVGSPNRARFESSGDPIRVGREERVERGHINQTIETWRRSIEAGQPYVLELRHRRADGVYRWFQARALPARDTEGHITD
jgi:PAS domain-containing protein